MRKWTHFLGRLLPGLKPQHVFLWDFSGDHYVTLRVEAGPRKNLLGAKLPWSTAGDCVTQSVEHSERHLLETALLRKMFSCFYFFFLWSLQVPHTLNDEQQELVAKLKEARPKSQWLCQTSPWSWGLPMKQLCLMENVPLRSPKKNLLGLGRTGRALGFLKAYGWFYNTWLRFIGNYLFWLMLWKQSSGIIQKMDLIHEWILQSLRLLRFCCCMKTGGGGAGRSKNTKNIVYHDMLWPHSDVSASCPPCVRHVSASCALCARPWVHFGRASKPCLPCVPLPSVRLVSALCPPWVRFGRRVPAMFSPCLRTCVRFGCASKPSLPCFVRSWPAVGQGCGTTHRVDIACSLVCFLHNIFIFDSPNSAFASGPYSWKTVGGLCWYNSRELRHKTLSGLQLACLRMSAHMAFAQALGSK